MRNLILLIAGCNILIGLTPPESGHWLHNPCADDIDFQIEADFAGLMFPGMVNSSVELCDKVGHFMNYGDGYYCGVFVASLYSLALISDSINDIEPIVEKALKVIPAESKNLPFKGTTISLVDAYDMSYRHAEQMIARNAGQINENEF